MVASDTRVCGPGFHARVYALLRQVPRGRVTTYGDLARALGHAGVARQVGWALAALPAGTDLPWQRVVGGTGRLSRPGTPGAVRQAIRLRAEGIDVTAGGKVVGFASLRHGFATNTVWR